MKKSGTIKIFSLVAIIMSVGFFAANKAQGGTQTEVAIMGKPIATRLASEWKTYQSKKWGYSVEYPAYWSARVTLENGASKPEYVIRERVSFFSPEYVEICIDVWINPYKLDLAEWFEKYRKWVAVVSDDSEINRCTATVSELPAICAREPGSPQAYGELKCIFREKNLIYRIRYFNSDDDQSEEIYRHMLYKFNFD